MAVVDYFDLCAEQYQRLRPVYPQELFQWLAHVVNARGRVLDCGAGNGQASFELAKYFDQVVAIDVGQNQLEQAKRLPNIQYHQMSAEKINFPDNHFDLIVAASAVHWFNLGKFYQEARRLLKSDGYLVVWTYTWPQTKHVAVNQVLDAIKNKLNPYWSEGSKLHLNEYKSLAFPFKEIDVPSFKFKVAWSLDELIGFFLTWACIRQHVELAAPGFIEECRIELSKVWRDVSKVEFIFPIYIKAGTHL